MLPTVAPFGQNTQGSPTENVAASTESPVVPLRYKPSVVPLPPPRTAVAPEQPAPAPDKKLHLATPATPAGPAPTPAAPHTAPPPAEEVPVKLKMSTRLQSSGDAPSGSPPGRVDKPAGVPFPVLAPSSAPVDADKATPPSIPAGLTMPPMGMKGRPAIFVPADESGVAPPLVPLMSKAAQANLGTRPPMVLNLRVAAAINGKKDGLPPPIPKPARTPAGKANARRTLLLVLLVVGVAGAGLYFYLNPWGATTVVKDVKAKIDAAAQLPGQAVEKAQGAMQGARGNEQARLDAAVRGEDIPERRGLNTPAPGTPLTPEETPDPAVATEKTTGSTSGRSSTLNQIDTTPVDAAAPVPSPRFVKWGQTLKVTGVFQGSPSRALIEGRLVRQGELIEPVLGVTFHGVDTERKNVILQDESGAQVRLKY